MSNYQHDMIFPEQVMLRYLDNPSYVVSSWGIVKHVCVADCNLENCQGAHPNAIGSEVKNPKWCLRGCIQTCDDKSCPFNHFCTAEEFYDYRSNDPKWFEKNKNFLENYYAEDCDLTHDSPHEVTFADYINFN